MTTTPASGGAAPQPLQLAVDQDLAVSALLLVPPQATSCYVFAHGAGAGMAHPFMAAMAQGLAQHGVATLRYQFPFMQAGSRRPDRPPVAHATVRAAVAEAARRCPQLPLFAGGKSFGGRMTSQAQAQQPLLQVQGLAFVGFPLHPAGKPALERAAHLAGVAAPMLFLQGTRDALADAALMAAVVQQLGSRATLTVVDDADHGFHVRASSGSDDAAVLQALCAALAAWIQRILHSSSP